MAERSYELSEIDMSLTTRQAATLLGVHVETIRRLARRAEIPSFKVGKDWRFKASALRDWAERTGDAPGAPLVLVIDDEDGICKALCALLESFGCRTAYALSGIEGLERVGRRTPDLILLDLKMPALSGADFLRILRTMHPDLPVVIVTGYPDSEMMARATAFGPLTLIAKPVRREQLARLLRLIFGKGSLRIQL